MVHSRSGLVMKLVCAIWFRVCITNELPDSREVRTIREGITRDSFSVCEPIFVYASERGVRTALMIRVLHSKLDHSVAWLDGKKPAY